MFFYCFNFHQMISAYLSPLHQGPSSLMQTIINIHNHLDVSHERLAYRRKKMQLIVILIASVVIVFLEILVEGQAVCCL